MKLSDIKQSKDILFHLLGVQKEGQHLKCPFHDEKKGSMSVWYQNNVWFWKCHAGCGSGTAIDAAMKIYGASSPADALRVLEKEQGIIIIRDEEYQEPIIDQTRAEQFIQYAHKNLMENFALREFYSQKRKIFDINTITKYRLGFVETQCFAEWHSWHITGWVFPITNCRGEVIAVKIHQEKRLRTQPKCLWCPFGTYPQEKPKNGTLTFWPPPEQFINKDFLIIAPGELKALALIDSGYNATSPTAGESKLPDRMLKRIAALNFGKIFINYDNDPTGKDFRDIMVKGLSALGMLAIPFTFSSNIKEILKYNIEEKPIEKSIDISEINKEWVFKNLDVLREQTLKDGIIPDIALKFTNQLSLEDKRAWFQQNQS